MDRIEVERDRRDDRRRVKRDQRERRRRKRAVGLDAVARDEREADPEQQIDQGDNGNGATPGLNLLRPAVFRAVR
jgi:hypothetical protein